MTALGPDSDQFVKLPAETGRVHLPLRDALMTAELDTTDPRLKASLQVLIRRLARFVERGYNYDYLTIQEMSSLVEAHSDEFKRLHGYDFPPLVPFFLPSVQILLFYRPDLDSEAIRLKLLELLEKLARRHIIVNEMELAAAIKRTWPHYRPPVESWREEPKVAKVLQ